MKIGHLIFGLTIAIGSVLSPLSAEVKGIYLAPETINGFVSPTERYLSLNPLSKVKPFLKQYGIKSEHVLLFDEAIAQEKIGFFGYHGARRAFMIYQDIIRIGIEEILGIPIRSDFHFLRIPGDPSLNIDSAQEFIKSHPQGINDNLALEKLQLLSMNMSLYSNYTLAWECSVHYFVQNRNITVYDYAGKLNSFFTSLGIDPAYISTAFDIGESMLSQQSGVLLQFFDTSIYELVDQQTYLATRRGALTPTQKPISELFLNKNFKDFSQFRLLLNNQYTLNPNTTLSIKRYTMTSPGEMAAYEKALRNYFRTLPVDLYQKEVYKAQLLSTWELE